MFVVGLIFVVGNFVISLVVMFLFYWFDDLFYLNVLYDSC